MLLFEYASYQQRATHLPLFLFLLSSWSMTASASITVLSTNHSYAHRQASFGGMLDDVGITAALVPLSAIDPYNYNGCATSRFPYPQNETSTPWIALVSQGDCTYTDKIRNMQNMGAVATIVGSNKPNGGLLVMPASGDVSDIYIPAVYITYYDYLDLETQGSHHPYPNLMINLKSHDIRYWPLLNVVLARVVAPALILIFLYTMAFRFRQRQRRKKECAREERVNNLPRRQYTKETRDPEDTEPDLCSICLEEYEEGVLLLILPCKHEFHVQCISQWLLTRKRFCPLCKMDACPASEEDGS